MKLEAFFGFLLIASLSSSTVANFGDGSSLSVENRIIDGIKTPYGMFRFMVPMWVERISSQKLNFGTFCGATLISDEYILSAAHCLDGDNIVRVKLYFGAHDISKDSEEGRKVMYAPKENVIVHEDFGKNIRLRNDIALVRLPEKVNFTHNIQPMRLPRRNQADLELDVAVILGWGYMGKDSQPDQLRYAQLRILPNVNCQDHFRIYYDPPSHICIDGQGRSACYGDSGGPAVIVDREDRQFTQVGIASYVSPRGCEKGFPFAYTRVTSFLDWIHRHTGIPIQD